MTCRREYVAPDPPVQRDSGAPLPTIVQGCAAASKTVATLLAALVRSAVGPKLAWSGHALVLDDVF